MFSLRYVYYNVGLSYCLERRAYNVYQTYMVSQQYVFYMFVLIYLL